MLTKVPRHTPHKYSRNMSDVCIGPDWKPVHSPIAIVIPNQVRLMCVCVWLSTSTSINCMLQMPYWVQTYRANHSNWPEYVFFFISSQTRIWNMNSNHGFGTNTGKTLSNQKNNWQTCLIHCEYAEIIVNSELTENYLKQFCPPRFGSRFVPHFALIRWLDIDKWFLYCHYLA